MSGIVGVYRLDGRPVDQTSLQQMVAALAHRGPDGSGLWAEASVGLGHCMLHTTPESLSEQLPLVSREGDLVLIADARIDNRAELADALEMECGSGTSDSQLILAAYRKWGKECLDRLLGVFAFALWDAKRKELFCGRDPIGVKPFYYHLTSRVFVFASEIKALFCLPETPRQLDESRIGDYLTATFDDKAITLYKGVSRLLPAHSLTVGPGAPRTRCYWSPDLSHEVRLSSDEEYGEAFRDIFGQAVHCRLRSAHPVGSLLSGGLDSSSIVCMADRLLAQEEGRRLHTFSAIFPSRAGTDGRIDERSYVQDVLNKGNLQPHYVRADHLSPLTHYDEMLWHVDEAVPAPNLYMDWALARAAQSQGVRVLLSGTDGDSVVSHGYEALAEYLRTGRWKALAAEAQALSKRFGSRTSPWQLVWSFGLRLLAPDSVVEMWRVLRGRPRVALPVVMPIDAGFARRIGLEDRVRALNRDGSSFIPTAREMHWFSLSSGLLVYALELLDKTAAASSLEMRYPFFDLRLIEFCLAVPAEQKLRHGWPRALLRNAMVDILPEQVRRRVDKSHLGSNFTLGLLEHERETLESALQDASQTIDEYVDVQALRDMYHRYAAQPLVHEKEAATLFLAITLVMWLNKSARVQPA